MDNQNSDERRKLLNRQLAQAAEEDRQAEAEAASTPDAARPIYVANCHWSEYEEPPIVEETFETEGERNAFISGFWTALNWDENDKALTDSFREAAVWARISDEGPF